MEKQSLIFNSKQEAKVASDHCLGFIASVALKSYLSISSDDYPKNFNVSSKTAKKIKNGLAESLNDFNLKTEIGSEDTLHIIQVYKNNFG